MISQLYCAAQPKRSSSYKLNYGIVIKNFLNPKGLPNPMSGSKVMAILLKGWILPIGGVASGKEASGQRLISLKSKTKRVKKIVQGKEEE